MAALTMAIEDEAATRARAMLPPARRDRVVVRNADGSVEAIYDNLAARFGRRPMPDQTLPTCAAS